MQILKWTQNCKSKNKQRHKAGYKLCTELKWFQSSDFGGKTLVTLSWHNNHGVYKICIKWERERYFGMIKYTHEKTESLSIFCLSSDNNKQKKTKAGNFCIIWLDLYFLKLIRPTELSKEYITKVLFFNFPSVILQNWYSGTLY